MKSVHLLALVVVAVLSLGIGYFVGADGQNKSASDMMEKAESDVKALASGGSDVVAADDSEVLATVNSKNITENDVENLYASLPQQYRQAPLAFVKAQLVEQLVSMEVIDQAAEAESLYKDAEFSDQLASVRSQLMQEFYIKKKIEELVTDDLVKAEYDKITAEFKPVQEVHARHILLKNEKEAADIVKLLDEGGDFAELAKEYSTGPSGPGGGDLGYFTKERMVPEFAAAAFELPTGEYTKTPVKTQFGYHVIKVEDKRDTQPPALETKEGEIRGKLSKSIVDKLVDELKAAADILIVPPKEEEKSTEKTPENAESKDESAKKN